METSYSPGTSKASVIARKEKNERKKRRKKERKKRNKTQVAS
jgi:hypothetical protein